MKASARQLVVLVVDDDPVDVLLIIDDDPVDVLLIEEALEPSQQVPR